MKFHLVDRIEAIEPGKRIVTSKALSLAEEYLSDHFPTFPVMPGVLMMEMLVQSAAWLTRVQQDYSKSCIVLAVAKNVRYASFVQPGQILRCEVDAINIGDSTAKFKGTGTVGDTQTLSARFEVRCFNLVDRRKDLAASDAAIVTDMKKQFELVGGPAALAVAGTDV